MSAKDCEGHFSEGWVGFYQSKVNRTQHANLASTDVRLMMPQFRHLGLQHSACACCCCLCAPAVVCGAQTDLDQGNPQLRTYQGRQAEKFYETFKQPHVPPRPGKAALPPRPESLTWGMGGTLPQGKMYLPVPAASDFKLSCKKYLVQKESEEMAHGMDMGRKRHVYDAAGVDRKNWRSNGFTLEDQLQRKAKVPEEMRTDARTIHRMAPPGLKGYMGAECTPHSPAKRGHGPSKRTACC